MKIHIDEDEWYPVYDFSLSYGKDYGTEIELPEYEIKHMKLIFEEFSRIQKRLRILFEEKEKVKYNE